MNIHPALLPKYGGKGYFGIKVHEAVIASGDKNTGVTVQFVNNNYDELLDRRIESNKFDIELLNSELSCLSKLVYDLDIKILFQCNALENIKHKTNHGDIKTPTSMSPK